MATVDRILAEVDRAADEIVQFTADLVRIPTVNPPGDEYEACARFLGESPAAAPVRRRVHRRRRPARAHRPSPARERRRARVGAAADRSCT